MKLPAPPPPLHELPDELSKDPLPFLKLLLESPQSATRDYLPWDKIRFKTPPPGLTHRQWWYALKMARSVMRRPLPLLDAEGRNFSYVLPDTVLRMTEEIGRRPAGRSRWRSTSPIQPPGIGT